MASATRPAVVKSGVRNRSATDERSPSCVSTSRSTMAPCGTRPTVVVFFVNVAAAPPALKPPTMTGPCATAYTSPFAALSGV